MESAAPISNESQVSLVKRSWPTIVSHGFWTTFYLNLFKRSPSYQLHFDRFARVPFDALESDVYFLAHATRTGFAFNAAVQLLESPDELRATLEDVGEKHRKFRLSGEHFEIVKDVLTDMIEDRLKNEPAGDAMAEAWKPCITTVIGLIMDSATGNSAAKP